MTKPNKLSNTSGISVYLEDVCLPPQDRRRDIVDVVCSIMDDNGPKKRMRPAQKYGNAADQFAAEHHGPYEARGRINRDRMEAVHLHNSGYPKMHDELNKRRSTARITAFAAQRNVDAVQQRNYNLCNTCMKNRKKKEPKKRRLAPYRSHDTKGRNNGRRNSSRITKPKSRQPRKRSACKKCRSSKISIVGSQCSSCSQIVEEDTKKGTDKPRIVTDEKMVVEERPSQCCDLNKKKTDDAQQLHVNCDGSQCSKEGSSCPKGHETDASVSSYDSYASLEHEPMDSK